MNIILNPFYTLFNHLAVNQVAIHMLVSLAVKICESWLRIDPCSLSNNMPLDSGETEILKIGETQYHLLNWRNQVLLFPCFNSFCTLFPNKTSRDSSNTFFSLSDILEKNSHRRLKYYFLQIWRASAVSQCYLYSLWEIWCRSLKFHLKDRHLAFKRLSCLLESVLERYMSYLTN